MKQLIDGGLLPPIGNVTWLSNLSPCLFGPKFPELFLWYIHLQCEACTVHLVFEDGFLFQLFVNDMWGLELRNKVVFVTRRVWVEVTSWRYVEPVTSSCFHDK